MQDFLDPSKTSLKICGVTLASDAEKLIELRVPALGVNFWPLSKRYISTEEATPLLLSTRGRITRVGVFVNAKPELPRNLLELGLIDLAQFHGDETPEYCAPFVKASLPFIKAIGVSNEDSLENITEYGANAILLDTAAPGIYGGTGKKFDWAHVHDFINAHPEIPVILAGGITPNNAADAIAEVHPAALDIASGAELSPGVKDFEKVKSIMGTILNTT